MGENIRGLIKIMLKRSINCEDSIILILWANFFKKCSLNYFRKLRNLIMVKALHIGLESPIFLYIHTYPPDSVRNIGRPQRASIVHGCWLELVVRQKTFSHILSRQCASRWLWGILLISFPVGSILKRCGKFHFHFFVECVQSNHISSFLSLHLYLTVQFFPTALGWKLFLATKFQVYSEDIC
jgi:hypothetical protein